MMEKVIVALDVDSTNDAEQLIHELWGKVGWFKVGLQLLFDLDRGFYRRFREKIQQTPAGKPISRLFLDYKFYDIPRTVSAAVVQAHQCGVDMLTLHAVDPDVMAAAVATRDRLASQYNSQLPVPKLIGVTVLTSVSQNREYPTEPNTEPNLRCNILGNRVSDVHDRVIKRARMAYDIGLDGVVCAAPDLHHIAPLWKNINQHQRPFLRVCPGIRLQPTAHNAHASIKNDDQARTATPHQAIMKGATHIVIGRLITQCKDAPTRRQVLSHLWDDQSFTQ